MEYFETRLVKVEENISLLIFKLLALESVLLKEYPELKQKLSIELNSMVDSVNKEKAMIDQTIGISSEEVLKLPLM